MKMEDDYIADIVRIHEWSTWLIRAVISVIFIALLAIILKYYLIEPYSASVLEFDVEFESVPMKKGDREI